MQVLCGSSTHAGSSPLNSSDSRRSEVKSARSSNREETARAHRISAVIAEDEPLAREALKSMLKREADVEIIAESSTGTQTLNAVHDFRPDVLFLDIDLPELNGFDVLAQIQSGYKPAVIFVSATEAAAAKAFDVHAMDYLVKPCPADRLHQALNKVRECMRQAHAQELHRKVDALIETVQEPRNSERIAIKSNGRIVFLRLADIDWAEAADNYVNLHAGAESHLFRETMNALEKRLSTKRFVRISRSALVNIEQIKELQLTFHGEYLVVLRNGTKITLTRGYREKLRDLSLM